MKYFLILFIFLFAFSSCKKNSSPTSANSSTMTVTIDGTTYSWGAGGVPGTIAGNSVISLDGTDGTGKNEKIILFDLTNITTVGTYSISNDSSKAQSVVMKYQADTTSIFSSEIASGSSGTFTVTAISNSGISANFNAVLPRKQGSLGNATVTITNGSLNITYL